MRNPGPIWITGFTVVLLLFSSTAICVHQRLRAAIPDTEPQKATAAVDPRRAEIDHIVLQTLNGMNSFGWDGMHRGIFINWRRDDPAKVQCRTDGDCDSPGHPTRHDKQNDIRALQHLYCYRWRHPGDTSMDFAIARLLPTVKHQWGNTALHKGWLYYVLLRLQNYAESPNERAYWRGVILHWAAAQYQAIDPSLGIMHGRIPNCDCGAHTIYLDDAYRVDAQVEVGAALVDAGARFNHAEWVKAGKRAVDVAYRQSFSPAYHLFGRIYVLQDHRYGRDHLWDTEAKAGEASEEADALTRAGAVTTDPALRREFFSIATKILNALRDGPIHDRKYGGIFFTLYVGRNFNGAPAGKVIKSYKESRQLSLAGTYRLANLAIAPYHQWDDMETEMVRLAVNTFNDSPPGMFFPNTVRDPQPVNGYPASAAGYVYRNYSDFKIYRDRAVPGGENWVTSEADNLALLGLQEELTPWPALLLSPGR